MQYKLDYNSASENLKTQPLPMLISFKTEEQSDLSGPGPCLLKEFNPGTLYVPCILPVLCPCSHSEYVMFSLVNTFPQKLICFHLCPGSCPFSYSSDLLKPLTCLIIILRVSSLHNLFSRCITIYEFPL